MLLLALVKMMTLDPLHNFSLVARRTRGSATECWHFGAAAVVTPTGQLIASVGNPEIPLFLRSCAKPIQALPFVRGGGVEEFGLEEADIALICASHSGRPEHVERVQGLLRRGGFEANDLLCGVHQPFDNEVKLGLLKSSVSPTVLHNNCSGKHAGMLLACKMMGFEAGDYTSMQHPLQEMILQAIAELGKVPETELRLGIDGCGLPTYLLSLAGGARIYASIADPGASDLKTSFVEALHTIGGGMASAPEMVAGVGRFATELTQATGGRLIAKEGAEGAFGVAVRGPVALGLVLKVADGSERIRDIVVVDILRQLGCLSAAELEQLRVFIKVDLRGHSGARVGEILPDVELIRVQ